MAPNGSYYGALKLAEDAPQRKGRSTLLVAALSCVALTAGVFYLTAAPAAVNAMSVVHKDVAGSATTRGPDCRCRGSCSPAVQADENHYCNVVPTDSCDDDDGDGKCNCVGINDKFFSERPGYVAATACVAANGTPTGNCQAACAFVYGRYDCWSFPCFNGGFCVDGVDTYTCHCPFGYDGEQCEDNIDECMITDADSDSDGALDSYAVCDENALCSDSDGAYSCVCNAGWQGDGYRENNVLDYNYPKWITRPTVAADPGYIQACEDIDDCLRGMCRNGATCINLEGIENGYECECSFGPTGLRAWVGHDCETNVDECDAADPKHDCDPHATCVDSPGAFSCSCNEHWQSVDTTAADHKGRMSGSELSISGCYDWPDCDSSPCVHGGTCSEGPDGCETTDVDGKAVMVDCYSCTCAYGWTGDDCELDENECTNSEDGEYITLDETCHDEAFCTNTPGSFECACNAGWTGDGITCMDADDCEFSPCAHGGTCYDCGTLCFTCDCVVGWRGTTCATDWNECIMGVHQCNDDGTCVNNPGSYDCRCDPGFTGNGFGQGFTAITDTYTIGSITVTETTYHGCKDIDDCDPELYDGWPDGPCVQGKCEDVGANAYVCSCDPGYTDANCDMNMNECDPILGDNECHRFAQCTDTSGSYNCICNEGYTGDGTASCLDISDCTGQCEHGFCSDLGVDDFKCTCDAGYMNRKCDFDVNECTTYTHECARHALCTNKIPHRDGVFYVCSCNVGWSGDGEAQGTGCVDIDDCASNPCDFGECADEGAAAYTCDCNEGFTDFNCDFDVNECYLKTHNCHVDARCVNIPGGFFCRCLSGWEGDGLTCTDLDDCDPDPCDPVHGTCEDEGPNAYNCICMGGWLGVECGDDEDECLAGTHACDPNASCSNTYGSHTCMCNKDYYGPKDAPPSLCSPCTTCPPGWKAQGICDVHDVTCVNVDECVEEVDNCHEHATCLDNQGSFKCECDQNGEEDEWWGIGILGATGCQACTKCYDGYHEIQPCTSTTDRMCEVNVSDGMYMLETEADDNRMCMALLQGEWYPSRINFGNGDAFCGFPGANEAAQKTALLSDGSAVFQFRALSDNDQRKARGGDMYTIEFNDGDGMRCLFFGDNGKDIYPSLQNCNSYDLDDKSSCPWNNGAKGLDYCGYAQDGMAPLDALLMNTQAIWRVTPLKLNEDKFILQSASKGKSSDEGNPIWECLAFEEQGAATNPSRYNWGNGDSWCGAGDWEGEGKVYGLLNNKQAVFILTFLQGPSQ